jgi:hypothetical protein
VVGSNETLTYVQEGVPPDTITIPSFNIPLYAGVMMIEHADEGIVVELPQLKGGTSPFTTIIPRYPSLTL